MTSVALPLSTTAIIPWQEATKFVRAVLSLEKPCWLSPITSLFLTCFSILSRRIHFMILPDTEVRPVFSWVFPISLSKNEIYVFPFAVSENFTRLPWLLKYDGYWLSYFHSQYSQDLWVHPHLVPWTHVPSDSLDGLKLCLLQWAACFHLLQLGCCGLNTWWWKSKKKKINSLPQPPPCPGDQDLCPSLREL